MGKAKEWEPFLPFDMEEYEANIAGEFIIKTMFYDGKKENCAAIRARCKAEGVSVGSMVLAASYMAMAQIHANNSCENPAEDYKGMKNQYLDTPANFRQNMNEYCGNYIGDITLKCDVDLETKLWDLAQYIQGHMKKSQQRGENFLSVGRVSGEWAGGETRDLAQSSFSKGRVSDLIVSNLMLYKYPVDFGWGEITTMTNSVGVGIGFFANLQLIIQTCNGKLGYSLVYSPGENNKKYATNFMNTFAHIMENSHKEWNPDLKAYLTGKA